MMFFRTFTLATLMLVGSLHMQALTSSTIVVNSQQRDNPTYPLPSLHVEGKWLDITAVPALTLSRPQPADVYTLSGQLLRKAAHRSQAIQGLPAGIYIIGGKKTVVR